MLRGSSESDITLVNICESMPGGAHGAPMDDEARAEYLKGRLRACNAAAMTGGLSGDGGAKAGGKVPALALGAPGIGLVGLAQLGTPVLHLAPGGGGDVVAKSGAPPVKQAPQPKVTGKAMPVAASPTTPQVPPKGCFTYLCNNNVDDRTRFCSVCQLVLRPLTTYICKHGTELEQELLVHMKASAREVRRCITEINEEATTNKMSIRDTVRDFNISEFMSGK